MKKFINVTDNMLTESLDGFAAAHADIVTLGAEHKFVRRRALKPGKVALISGGGSGHEPLHAGFVGHGMLDAACPGQVFTSPTPDQMVAAVEAVDTGAGCVLHRQELRRRRDELPDGRRPRGRNIATIITDDDVAVETSTWSTGRRGVAGTMIVEKIVGAAAEQGAALSQLKDLGDRVNRQTRSMGVALTSCTVPAAGNPTFQLGDSEMEMGVGIHGEPGRRRVQLATADAIAAEMVGRDPRRSRFETGNGSVPFRQRLRRHAGDGAVPDGQLGVARVAEEGTRRVPLSHRELRHIAGNGGLLYHCVLCSMPSCGRIGMRPCERPRCAGGCEPIFRYLRAGMDLGADASASRSASRVAVASSRYAGACWGICASNCRQ